MRELNGFAQLVLSEAVGYCSILGFSSRRECKEADTGRANVAVHDQHLKNEVGMGVRLRK